MYILSGPCIFSDFLLCKMLNKDLYLSLVLFSQICFVKVKFYGISGKLQVIAYNLCKIGTVFSLVIYDFVK